MGKDHKVTPRRGIDKSNHSMNPDRERKSLNMRDRATIRRLLMYKNQMPIRNRKGKIVKAAPYQSWINSGAVSRIAPNQKWFGNTKVITQTALQNFQNALGNVMEDPYQVVMRQTKLPVTLLNERAKKKKVHIIDTGTFAQTFGPKAQRKKPLLSATDLQELRKLAEDREQKYNPANDKNLSLDDGGVRDEAKESIMLKGQSKRIWNELYKVIDSSDVVIQVLDARDPMGTRSKFIEHFIRKEKAHKHLVFVLNKCDLIPTWVTQRWVTILSAEFPTMAFHASMRNSFGKGALINLLRQFGKLHTDKKQISVGLIGYPNVGKSSIINALKAKKVCSTAPIAGETKVWQYVTLMRKIYLIDCPGVVYPQGDSDTQVVLKGVVRVENIKDPEDHIPEILNRVKHDYLKKTYRIEDWSDPNDFLEKIARRYGKLLKGGEPDVNTVAKMVLNDFQRGKLPYFVRPPTLEENPMKNNAHTLKKKGEAQEGNKIKPSVNQNFNKIEVENEYGGEDIEPLKPIDDYTDDEEQDESDIEENDGADKHATLRDIFEEKMQTTKNPNKDFGVKKLQEANKRVSVYQAQWLAKKMGLKMTPMEITKILTATEEELENKEEAAKRRNREKDKTFWEPFEQQQQQATERLQRAPSYDLAAEHVKIETLPKLKNVTSVNREIIADVPQKGRSSLRGSATNDRQNSWIVVNELSSISKRTQRNVYKTYERRGGMVDERDSEDHFDYRQKEDHMGNWKVEQMLAADNRSVRKKSGREKQLVNRKRRGFAVTRMVMNDLKRETVAAKKRRRKEQAVEEGNKFEDDENGHGVQGPTEPKLTGKAKRAQYNAQKIKRIGIHYYETANVKNRNRDCVKFANPELAIRGRMKKKPMKGR
ncbi:nucleolar GTP-binding protein 2-like [Tropilaelaps mercedesae]|uniref:Nucleolar GTP-binding protein 2 n=1 Tax=Tropilaelaps mercedesae TaxID=418985 RepID=A0A1V9Y3V1_9ACAR|nr:nucleolar GTP-binding protein 2-like [Tropilaelaps mercedesae]